MSKIERTINRLKKIAKKNVSKNHEITLSALSACSAILYLYSQTYIDNEIEKILETESETLLCGKINSFDNNKGRVLFYDGFADDLRGLALIYLKALVKSGYDVVYVTDKKGKGNQPNVIKVLNNSIVIYKNLKIKHTKKVKIIDEIFQKYKPEYAFLYCFPDDIAAALVFKKYEKIVKRYLINLTDHRYWTGINSFDYIIEFRSVGANISNYYRTIPKEKIRLIPMYPVINKEEKFQGFPFDVKDKKVVFSGGCLNKTFGDDGFTYYRIVEHILENHKDVVFLYASRRGNKTELVKILQKYPNRAYWIDERTDLYQILENCTIYLNTYPECGGLMTQYAAAAGKIPIILKHSMDEDNILLEQEKRKISYFDYETLVRDVDRLIDDDNYRKERESLLHDSVISEEIFNNQLVKLIEQDKTDFNIEWNNVDIKQITDVYLIANNNDNFKTDGIAKKQNAALIRYFPFVFIKKVILRMLRKR